MTIVNSITQKNMPIAEINKPVMIKFDLNTDGKPDDPNARIEARVISDAIITNMSHAASNPPSSIFVQSEDKKQASVISIKENNNSGWGSNRNITLQFNSLPSGKQDYIVGTLYYYNANGSVGPGTPLTVKLDNEDVYPKLIGANLVSCEGFMPFNSFLLGSDLTFGHVYKIVFSHPIERVSSCPENMSFDAEMKACSIYNTANVKFYGEGLEHFKALTSGSPAEIYSNRYAYFPSDYTQQIKVTLWDYGYASDEL